MKKFILAILITLFLTSSAQAYYWKVGSVYFKVLSTGVSVSGGPFSPTTMCLPSSNASPTATGEIRHDSTITGMTRGALTWFDGTGVRQLVDLPTTPSNDDYVVAYDADDDIFYMKVDANTGSPTAINDIGDAAGDGTISQTGYKQTFTSTLNTAGSVWTFTNTTADLTSDVSFFDFKYTDDGDANGYFMRGYDNATDLKWYIGVDGSVSFGSAGFTVDADGDVIGKSFTNPKVNGVAGASLLYEATTTETNGAGWMGPASRASDLYLQYSDADPAINQFMLFPAPTTGTSKYVWTTYGQFAALPIVTTSTITAGSGPTTLTDAAGKILSASLNTVLIANGGTGLTSFTAGDIPYYASGTEFSKLAKGAAYQLLQMNAGATAPEWTSTISLASLNMSSGTSSIPWLVGVASGLPGTCTIGMTWFASDTGVQYNCTATNTWSKIAKNPMTGPGDMTVGGTGGVTSRLAAGATTDIMVGGGAAPPVWTASTGSGAPVRADSPTFVDDITIGAAGIILTSDGDGAVTIAGLGNGTDENLIINFDDTADTVGISTGTGVTNINMSAIGLITTGAIQGGINVTKDDDTLAADQCYGTAHWYSGGAETVTLPAAVVGMNLLAFASDATVKHIDPNGTDTIVLNGTALAAGYQIESPGAVGDFIALMCFTANQWTTLGRSGTWITHGAD